MLTIRLQRVGRTNDPSFRVILTDSKRAARTGGFVEILGNYDARKGTPALQVDRIKHWLSVGAKTSGTVHNLLLSEKVIEGKKINVLPKKSPPPKEAPKEEVKQEEKAEAKKEAESEMAEAPEGEAQAEEPKVEEETPAPKETVEPEAKPEEPAEAPVEASEEPEKKSTEETPA